MKEGDQPQQQSSQGPNSAYSSNGNGNISSVDSNIKPPDRSTSAPPVLSLHTESLFAFRAAEHLQLFADIRCEDNYYEFYSKYSQTGGGGAGGKALLPPPLENQPFLMVERGTTAPGGAAAAAAAAYIEEERQQQQQQQHVHAIPHSSSQQHQQQQAPPPVQQQPVPLLQQSQPPAPQQQQQPPPPASMPHPYQQPQPPPQQQQQYQPPPPQMHPQQQQQHQHQQHIHAPQPHHPQQHQLVHQQMQQQAPPPPPQQQQYHPQQQQMYQHHPHQMPPYYQQQPPMHSPHMPPPPHQLSQQQQQHLQHLQYLQHQQQPHLPRGYSGEHRFSVPDVRTPHNLPPRSNSNPYVRNGYDRFESVPEEPLHLAEEMGRGRSSSPTHEAIWAPLPRSKLPPNMAFDEFGNADDHQQQQQQQGYALPPPNSKPPQQQQHPQAGGRHPHMQDYFKPDKLLFGGGGPQQGMREQGMREQGIREQGMRENPDPSLYYQNNDFDNVAYRSANQLLKEDNIQSLWREDLGGYDQRQQAPQQYQPPAPQHRHPMPHIAAPTPTLASQSSLLALLGNGFVGDIAPDKITSRRRASSGGRMTLPSISSTSPPLPSLPSTSPVLPVCRYYAQGFCSRGERCNFLHEDQLNQLQQDSQFSIVKPKPKKLVASSPPLGMPQKTPSPVHPRLGNGPISNGSGSANGTSSNGGATTSQQPALASLLASMSAMNLGSSNGTNAQGTTPRSTTPNNTQNGMDIFASGGSTSPNGKSDLSRQYTSIEQVIGHIYSLCKDQHGCRFLQKRLEDSDPMVVEIIFNEVYDHMTELMIDPFGNYLCQKLLEHCNDEQRLHIIERVAPDLVKISKNMHGTRAVQQMIEYLTTPEQVSPVSTYCISIAKKALANHVVTLIQDLNGNHVIQRCLNKLSPQDNQFIYDSVSQAGHCVEVATHRHGCCVLQRCIDHASDSQKVQLINEIIANALVLVQDPYGNYVVQYVLDLPFPGLASRLARRFLGHIPILSTQKFSSNVVEKCLNVTDIQTRANIIQELVEYDNLLYLLQDPYANYVIQTSLNVSEPVQHARLVEAIRPHLSSLRNTPYGKRIQNKILKESSRDYYP